MFFEKYYKPVEKLLIAPFDISLGDYSLSVAKSNLANSLVAKSRQLFESIARVQEYLIFIRKAYNHRFDTIVLDLFL